MSLMLKSNASTFMCPQSANRPGSRKTDFGMGPFGCLGPRCVAWRLWTDDGNGQPIAVAGEKLHYCGMTAKPHWEQARELWVL